MTRNADSLVLTIDMAHWRAPNGWRVAAEGSRWHSARGDGGRRDIAGGLAVPVSGRSQRYPIIAVAVLKVSATGRHILRRHRASADLLYLCKRHHFDDGGRVRMVEPCWRQVRRYGAHQIPDPQACVIARLGPRGRPAQRTGRNCRSVHSDERACR